MLGSSEIGFPYLPTNTCRGTMQATKPTLTQKVLCSGREGSDQRSAQICSYTHSCVGLRRPGGESTLFPPHLPPFPIQEARVRDQRWKTRNPALLMLEQPEMFEAKPWGVQSGV